MRGKRTTVLTGAGISTDSGIPDYRSPGAPRRKPMTFQQFLSGPEWRSHYWARNQYGWTHMTDRRPNPGHTALAALEAGFLRGIITQNIDRLHQSAGSIDVIDLHGRYDRVGCLTCETTLTRAQWGLALDAANPSFYDGLDEVADVEIAPDADAVIESTASFVVPGCPVCGGIIKPDVVYFGETVPTRRVVRANAWIDVADVVLVAGSSLAVHSGKRFVTRAARNGTAVIIVNRGPTKADDLATVRIDAGTSEALTLLADALL